MKPISKITKNFNIQTKFFLYFSILSFAIISFVLLTIFYFQREAILNKARDKAFELTRILAYSSVNAVLLDDYTILQMLIDSMSDSPDIRSIAIIDTGGTVMAASDPKMRGTQYKDELSRKALSGDTFILQNESSSGGDEVWNTALIIYNLNEPVGVARLKYSIHNAYGNLINTIAGIGLLAILLSFIMAYQLAKTFSNPIKEVVHLADEYGKGNFQAEINVQRNDEIGHLITSLNLLSHKLQILIEEKVNNENLMMIGEFSSFIMHDIKNPLAGIYLLAEGINYAISDDDPLKEYSNELLLSVKKVQDFTQQTLDIARINKISLQLIDIRGLIQKTLDGLNLKKVKIITHFDPLFTGMHADERMLSMAIRNLLTNAAEAVSINGKIIIQTKKLDDEGVIIIEDNGIGIDEERLKTIFRPFISDKPGGHGMGLAMVKKAVISHHGKIKAESVLGEGTKFTITLPLNGLF